MQQLCLEVMTDALRLLLDGSSVIDVFAVNSDETKTCTEVRREKIAQSSDRMPPALGRRHRTEWTALQCTELDGTSSGLICPAMS